MIEIYAPIDETLVTPLEDYFCELEASPWMIILKTDQDGYKLHGYFQEKDLAHQAWENLSRDFDSLPGNPQVNILHEEDWKNEYKKYLKPWSSRPLHWVPVWLKDTYEVPEGDVAIYLDADMAFGTGAHETTQLCAEALIQVYQKKQNVCQNLSVIDAGCGSGILALSAKKLGFGDTEAFDIDPDSVKVSLENAEKNNLLGQVNFFEASLETALGGKKADAILANILADIISENAELLLNCVNPKGSLVLSGILDEESQCVQESFTPLASILWGSYDLRITKKGEWVSLVYSRLKE